MSFTKLILYRNGQLLPFAFALFLILCGCKEINRNEAGSIKMDSGSVYPVKKNSALPNLDSSKLKSAVLFNRKNDSFSFADVTKEKNTLFFFASTYSCFNCVNEQLQLLSKALPKTRLNQLTNTIVLYAHPNYRNILTLMKQVELNIPLCWLADTDLGINFDEYPGPLFFVYESKTKKFKAILDPTNQTEDQIITYINNVQSKYHMSNENH